MLGAGVTTSPHKIRSRFPAFISSSSESVRGARSGEAEAITWAQIDLNRAIFFPDAERNKTGDSRVKALADHTVEALQKITPNDAKDRKRFMLANKDEHVFDTTNYKKLFNEHA